MSLLIEFLIGAGIGTLAAILLRSERLLGGLLAGAAGAIILGSLFSVLSTAPAASYFISGAGLLLAIIGALIGIALWWTLRYFAKRHYSK